MVTPLPGDDTYDPVYQGIPCNIVGNSIRSISGTLQSAATGTGYGTAMTVTGMKVVAIQAVSTATSFTADIEVSVDGTNYIASAAILPVTDATQTTYVTTISANGIWSLVCAGITKIRANISAVTPGSGSVTIKAVAVA